jgi:predicted nuclease of restriction endonuclease-like (RecB) superfamily
MKSQTVTLPETYPQLLREIKSRIRSARSRAVLAANQEMLLLYWDIGKLIVTRQNSEGWGKAVVERLSTDICEEFTGIKGFSPRNLWNMRRFYDAWSDEEFLQQAVAEIPWGHNLVSLNKLKDPTLRLWYAHKTIENGWSRAVLSAQIESDFHKRLGSAITNFARTLPPPQSDLAQQTLKDPYIFDFLTLSEKAAERDLENALLEKITEFLLELGVGFAFLGRNFSIEVGGDDFYIDLLFYHIHLHCYVVIDLKMEKFKPEFAGKMNFYLAAVDTQLRREKDAPSIGLILCKEKNRMVVEYALRETNRPVGVASWKLTGKLPESLEGELPSPQEIEKHILTTLQTMSNE